MRSHGGRLNLGVEAVENCSPNLPIAIGGFGHKATVWFVVPIGAFNGISA